MGSALDLGALGRILVGAATAALLAGCALQGASPLPLSTSLSESTATFGDAQGDWPTDSWWTSYGDDQLDGLVAEGISHAPTLAAALARVRSADAVAGQAGAARSPQVSANASVNDQKQISTRSAASNAERTMPATRGGPSMTIRSYPAAASGNSRCSRSRARATTPKSLPSPSRARCSDQSSAEP